MPGENRLRNRIDNFANYELMAYCVFMKQIGIFNFSLTFIIYVNVNVLYAVIYDINIIYSKMCLFVFASLT